MEEPNSQSWRTRKSTALGQIGRVSEDLIRGAPASREETRERFVHYEDDLIKNAVTMLLVRVLLSVDTSHRTSLTGLPSRLILRTRTDVPCRVVVSTEPLDYG